MSGLVAAGAVQGVVPERQQGRQQGQHCVVVQVVVLLAVVVVVVVVVAAGQVGLEQAAEFRGLELGLQRQGVVDHPACASKA